MALRSKPSSTLLSRRWDVRWSRGRTREDVTTMQIQEGRIPMQLLHETNPMQIPTSTRDYRKASPFCVHSLTLSVLRHRDNGER
ncbi:hypothetical protein CgunFtcFv8_012645 [Champsocephalus gunnari]|uniref:Uncharacterized protein n=1 Tax=Champsocephalus gunnari TaxID=52237 RepID=A0AAN8DSL8_CHAGU|nr:hypothetical protein CgunFtcFv8_012645 [Champsocephalus gunnari]